MEYQIVDILSDDSPYGSGMLDLRQVSASDASLSTICKDGNCFVIPNVVLYRNGLRMYYWSCRVMQVY